MNVELKGTIKVITQTEIISDKLTKRQVVVTIEGDTQYPQDISVEAVNKKVEDLQSFKVGDMVSVTANLRGRENKGKYYNSFSLISIIGQNPY